MRWSKLVSFITSCRCCCISGMILGKVSWVKRIVYLICGLPQLTCRGEVSSIRAIASSSGTRRTLSMKQFCVLLLALAVGCSLLALSPKSKESGGGVEKTITQLEDASRDAALKGDPSFAEKNLADDFVRITADGKLMNKQEFIDNFKKSKY